MSPLQLRTPSFRSRLRLFFVVIVLIPMITMAVVLFRLIVRAERSQTDAQLAKSRRSRSRSSRELETEAGDVAQQIGERSAARRRGGFTQRPAAVQRAARRPDEARPAPHTPTLRLDGEGRFESGDLPAVAPADLRLLDDQGNPAGRLTVAMESAEEFAHRIEELTGADVVVEEGETRRRLDPGDRAGRSARRGRRRDRWSRLPRPDP